MNTQMKCAFCEKLKNNKNQIYEDDLIVVLLDIDPISKGHILVLPKAHYLDLDEMPDHIISRIFQFGKVYVGLLKELYNPKGYSMMQNGGVYNDIGHFHLHIFPRYSKEEFGWTYVDKVEEGASDFETLKKILVPRLISKLDN